MTFVENGQGRPQLKDILGSGGVESPIGTDGENRRPPLFFPHFVILFHADPVAGLGALEAIITTTEDVRQRAAKEVSGLTNALGALNNAIRTADNEQRAKLEELQKECDAAVAAAKVHRL